MDSEYKYSTAYKPLRNPILYKKIYLKIGKIIPVTYGITIASPALY
jgi:hypothetical protein